jgi:hypothetical protein
VRFFMMLQTPSCIYSGPAAVNREQENPQGILEK